MHMYICMCMHMHMWMCMHMCMCTPTYGHWTGGDEAVYIFTHNDLIHKTY